MSYQEDNDSLLESANDDNNGVRSNVEANRNVKIAFFLLGFFVCSIPSISALPCLAYMDIIDCSNIMPSYLWDNDAIPIFVATIGFMVYGFLCKNMRKQAEKYKRQGENVKGMALVAGINFSLVFMCIVFIVLCVLHSVKPLL